jgi:hypothetical protein
LKISITISFIYYYNNVRIRRSSNVNIHNTAYEGGINQKSQTHFFKFYGQRNSFERRLYSFLKKEHLIRNRKFDETKICYGKDLSQILIIKREELLAPKNENLKRIATHVNFCLRKKVFAWEHYE